MKAGRHTGRWIVLVLLGALAAVPIAARGANGEVTIKQAKFNPPVVSIAPGEAVVWTDEEGGHSVTFDDGFDQPQGCIVSLGTAVNCSREGDRFQRPFPEAGDFPYYCKVHRSSGMTGVVRVKVTGQSTTTTAPAATTQPPTTVTTASTTTTTRKLATSSTLAPTTTSTVPAESTTTIAPNEAPAFDPGDDGSGDGQSGAPPASGGGGDSGSGTVALIVALLLAVAGGGGLLLWRLRPRPAQP